MVTSQGGQGCNENSGQDNGDFERFLVSAESNTSKLKKEEKEKTTRSKKSHFYSNTNQSVRNGSRK